MKRKFLEHRTKKELNKIATELTPNTNTKKITKEKLINKLQSFSFKELKNSLNK